MTSHQQTVDPKMTTNEPAVKPTDQQIYDNYATPLIGQFLNLPNEPVQITCPACGLSELSEMKNDLKWYCSTINNIFGCFFVSFCCCFCFDYSMPCKDTDQNHYCKNCGCYFGRVMKQKRLLIKKK